MLADIDASNSLLPVDNNFLWRLSGLKSNFFLIKANMMCNEIKPFAFSIKFEAQPFTFSSQDTTFDKMNSFGFKQVFYPTTFSHLADLSKKLMDETSSLNIDTENQDLFAASSIYCTVLIFPKYDKSTRHADYVKVSTSPYAKQYFLANISKTQKFNQSLGLYHNKNFKSYAASAFYGNVFLK